MAEGIERTKEITKRAVGKCLPNADRLSNSVKSLIDKIMKGQIFQNASALGALQWLLCSEDLKTLVSAIPPWAYDGTSGSADVTPDQQNFYNRITGVGGGDLLSKLRTLQYGPESSFGSQPTFTDNLTNQQIQMSAFKSHTDDQSGVGDPVAFQRTMGIASAYDSSKQQMEGTDQDNFTGFFNSSIQGPIIVDQMKNLLCNRDSVGQILRSILDLIAGSLPFTLDDIAALLGGLSIDEFFDNLDQMLSELAGFFEYLNYIVSLDLSQFSLAEAYIQKFTLGQFLAAMVNGDGRGNCIMRAMLEEFTGSDNLRDAITAIDIERDKEERAAAAASDAQTESGKQRAYDSETKEKEIFFEPVPDELILQGVVTGTPTPTPPPIDAATAAMIQDRLSQLDARTMSLGYEQERLRNLTLVAPTSTPEFLDGGYFNEDEEGGEDGLVPSDSEWYSPPTPTPTPSSVLLGDGGIQDGGGSEPPPSSQ
jgi:hypothetical protein